MKRKIIRPIPILAFAYLVSVALAILMPFDSIITAAIIIAAVSACAFVCCFISNLSKILPCVILTISIALGSFYILSYGIKEFTDKTEYKNADIYATVKSVRISQSRNRYYVIKADKINGKAAPRNFNMLLFCSDGEKLYDYDKIHFTANITESFESSEESFYLSSAVFMSAQSNSEIITTNKNEFSLLREICKIRDKLVFKIRTVIPNENGDILSAVLFGKRDYVDDETTEIFSSAGISHLLAISGLHVSILVFILSFILTALNIGRIPRSIICVIFTFILMSMTGFTVSVVRAGIMNLFLIISGLLRRDYDGISVLSLCAIILAIINPYVIINVGFLLSFSATLGIIISSEILVTIRRRFSYKTVLLSRLIAFDILSAVIPTIAAFLFTIPITAFVFSSIPTYSIITNILISPLITIMLSFAFIASIFLLFNAGFIAGILLKVSAFALNIIVKLAEKISSLPYSKIYTDKTVGLLLIIISAILFTVAYFSKKQLKAYFISFMLIICTLCSLLIFSYTSKKGNTEIYQFGNNKSCIAICTEEQIFICGYNKNAEYDVSSLLKEKGNLDFTLLSIPAASEGDISSILKIHDLQKLHGLCVPKEHLISAKQVAAKVNLSEIYADDMIKANSKSFSFESYSNGKNYYSFLKTGDFKITVAEKSNSKSELILPECDLLICNEKCVNECDFKAKYIILSEKSIKTENVASKLADTNTVLLLPSDKFIFKKGKPIYELISL